MKKIRKHYSLLNLSLLYAGTLMICAWHNPLPKNSNIDFTGENINDTVPADDNNFDQKVFDKTMKQLDLNMANLDVQLKNLDINVENVKTSLADINYDEIGKQIETSLKNIDWEKMQTDVNKSIVAAKNEVAKIDLEKMQNNLQQLQKKLQSEEFKSQFNSEKMQKQINEVMVNAKQEMEKAKLKLQHLKDFTDELAADNLIDKKKGYTIEWKNKSLFINGKEQTKDVSDKYRKYEDVGKIKVLPENAERF